MYHIKAVNLTDAYYQGLALIDKEGYLADSRNGKVLKFPRPVVTSYEYPKEHVLFDAARDANPFFHMFEAMWMLGGSNDVAFVGQFAKQMYEYSDDGKTLHGAYGHRWRNHFKVDQLDLAIFELQKNPLSRRVVLGMWDPYIDPLVAEAGGKDVPCNTQVFFNTRPNGELDMTVTNRSNDMIWGAYGANAVHMSILHEYVALSVGLPLGVYYQVSNDLHVYAPHFALVKSQSLNEWENPYQGDSPDEIGLGFEPLFYNVVGTRRVETRDQFDQDVKTFLADPFSKENDYKTAWFSKTVERMVAAWKLKKAGFYASALEVASQIEAEDWRLACEQWLQRRPPKVLQISGGE